MNDEFRGISYSVSGCAFQNESDVNSVSVEPVPQSTMSEHQYTTPPSSRMWRSGLGGGGIGDGGSGGGLGGGGGGLGGGGGGLGGGGGIGGGDSNSPISKCCIGHFIKGYKSKAGFVTPSFSPSNDRESASALDSDSASEREGPDSAPDSGTGSRMQMISRTVARRIDFSVSPPSTPRRNVCDDASVRLAPETDHCETSPVPSHHRDTEHEEASAVVGVCSVCYDVLPLRANHIYTMCGHLFCVKCLFTWGQQNLTCPMCRKPLYEVDDGAEDNAGGGDDAIIDAAFARFNYYVDAWRDDADDFDVGYVGDVVVAGADVADADDDADADDVVADVAPVAPVAPVADVAFVADADVADADAADFVDIVEMHIQSNTQNIVTYNRWNAAEDFHLSASFGLDGGEVMVIGRNVYPDWRRQYLINRFIHDDDHFQWTGFVMTDDTAVTMITPSEVESLRVARNLAITAIRHNIYQSILLTNQVFNGAIAHSFIPKTEYLNIPDNRFGRDHFYEFVICSRDSPDFQNYRTAEANVFGFITEITVTDVRDTHLLDYQTWETTHEYCFIVEVFDPLWNDGAYDETDGYINIQQFETRTLRFTDIRRMYSIWAAIRDSSP